MCIPVLNLEECNKSIELNMVSCGAQSSVPVAYSLAKVFKKNIKYIETISTISSKSAGPATRLNLDEYIYTTQRAIKYFSGIKNTKAILNLNPAVPCINMQTTTYAQIKKNINKSELKKFKDLLRIIIIRMTKYIKGHKIIIEPIVTDNVISVKTRTIGRGDYLPKYAGNLDIINCAAIAAGEHYAKKKQKNNN
jgi:acetaldehyde dehydrogenase (acetylating)